MTGIRLLFFVFIFFISCANKPKLFRNHPMVVYIEEHTKGTGMYSGNFGDIIVLDLATRQIMNITDDSYIDEEPCFSHDKKSLIFATSRSGSDRSLMFQGLGAPKQLYLYNVEKGDHDIIDLYNKYKDTLSIDFDILEYSTDSKRIYFASQLDVYIYDLENKSLKFVKSYQGNNSIERIIAIPESNKFIVQYINYDKVIRYLSLIDENRHETKLISLKYGINFIGGWSGNKDCIFVTSTRDELFEYDMNLDKYNKIELAQKDFLFPTDRCYRIGENKILSFAKRNEDANPEIVTYDLKTKKYEWLTNTGKKKTDLNVNGVYQ